MSGVPKIALGDVQDVRGYVTATIDNLMIPLSDVNRGELIGDGIELVWAKHESLPPGASLRAELSPWLKHRLIDRARAIPGYQRNTRAGTATMISATGAAHEHGGEAHPFGRANRERERAHSRISLAGIRSAADLQDPRITGRIVGTPSHAPLPPERARRVFEDIEAERDEVDWTYAVRPDSASESA